MGVEPVKELQSLLLSLDLLVAFVRGIEFQAREKARRFAPSTPLRLAYEKRLGELEALRLHATRLYDAEMEATSRQRKAFSPPELEHFQRLYTPSACASLPIDDQELHVLLDLIAHHFLSSDRFDAESASVLQSIDRKLSRIAETEAARSHSRLLRSTEQDPPRPPENEPPSRNSPPIPALRVLGRSK